MNLKDIQLGNRKVGFGHKPFIIAEMSGNHNQSLERAIALIDAAAEAGVDALKIQTYTAETMTIDGERDEFKVNDPAGLWSGKSLFELYKEAYTPWEWHEAIFAHCKKRNIIGFSTPFDETAVDFLESLNVPFYKIASFENTDIPLIKRVAKTGKPVIMSTGMASVAELSESVAALRHAGCENFILLKCTSTYPASPENTNILTIPHMRELCGCHVGLSDHTMGVGVSVASVILGARVIEKHFTLNREEGGVDAAFSLEPQELASLVVETERAWQSLGKVSYGAIGNEEKMKMYRRSIYAVQDIREGEPFTQDNIRIIRPGLGLAPKYKEQVLNAHASREIQKGSPIAWEMISIE